MSQLAIVEAFADLPDTRRTAGQRHSQALCLGLFTLAVVAGNRGFLAIGDWLKAYHEELVAIFSPPKDACHPTARFAGRCCGWSIRFIQRVYRDFSAFDHCQEKRLPPMAKCCGGRMKPKAMTQK